MRRSVLGSIFPQYLRFEIEFDTVSLPVMFLILYWCKRGRAASMDWLMFAPFCPVAVSVSLFDMLFYPTREIVSLEYSLVERALMLSRVLWFYLCSLLWPTDLALIYPTGRSSLRTLLRGSALWPHLHCLRCSGSC